MCQIRFVLWCVCDCTVQKCHGVGEVKTANLPWQWLMRR